MGFSPSLFLLSLFLLPLLSLGVPTWVNTIPNNNPGSPTPREFQILANIPSTSINVLFSGVTYNGSTYDVEDTWILDTSVASWKSPVPIASPPARGYSVAGVVLNQVIMHGGHTEGNLIFLDDVWRYTPSSNMWTQDEYNYTNVLLKRSFHAGLAVDDTLYVFGGYVAPLQTSGNDLWSYNTTTQNWTQLSPNGRKDAPLPRQGHSAVYYEDPVNGDSIIFFGGYNGTGGYSDTWQYVIGSNTWIELTINADPTGPHPRWGHSAVMVDSGSGPEMIVFGGSFVGGPINPYYNDVWKLSSNGSTWVWTQLLEDGNTEGPWRRGGHSAIVSDGRVFIFGGYGMYVGLYNDVWELQDF